MTCPKVLKGVLLNIKIPFKCLLYLNLTDMEKTYKNMLLKYHLYIFSL